MTNINKNIRFYQPNDPYYYQVDNLPLVDLLNNDITLENRLSELEQSVNAVITGGTQGTITLGSISDLKAYVEPLDGDIDNFGRIYVRPGKFNCRMQLPATRESGWRMMRDDDNFFNNTNFNGTGGLISTNTEADFVRETKGLARTAIVEFYQTSTGTDKFIEVPSFDASEFNSASPPAERLDLIYIKGSKSLDTRYESTNIPEASLGIIRGAYFRTDAAAGLKGNGPRFDNPVARLSGKVTGMSNAQIPAGTNLPNFGSVPLPDDLVNFAWHKTTLDTLDSTLMNQQVETQAAFCLPVAYVRVPAGYTQGQSIDPSNVVDIRPFFRTAELTYNERAAIASAVRPNGSNPFVTRTALDAELAALTNGSSENSNRIEILTGQVEVVQVEVNDIKNDLYGTGTLETPTSKNFEGRIINLEAGSTGGGGSGAGHKVHMFSFPVAIAGGSTAIFGTNFPAYHSIGPLVLPSHQNKVVAGLFTVRSEPLAGLAQSLALRIGATSTDFLISEAIAIPNMSFQPKHYHSFQCAVDEGGSGSSYYAVFRTTTAGVDGHVFTLWCTGYIYEG